MFIAHRINYLDVNIAQTIFGLSDGIEFDIRDTGGRIIVTHDPFHDGSVGPQGGQDFKDFVNFCVPNKIYIVNVKSEGIERTAIQIMESHGLMNFFLLDCSIPMMIALGSEGERRMAVRYSEYESIENVQAMAPFVSWVWVDTFTSLPLTKVLEETIHRLGLRICLVSPELQKQQDKLLEYKHILQTQDICVDAVCSKDYNRDIWN